jgi:hypothetical protein
MCNDINDCQNRVESHKVLEFNSYFIFTLIFFIVLTTGAFNGALANGSGQNSLDPTAMGPYKIGHTTMLVTDPSRFADSTPKSRLTTVK